MSKVSCSISTILHHRQTTIFMPPIQGSIDNTGNQPPRFSIQDRYIDFSNNSHISTTKHRGHHTNRSALHISQHASNTLVIGSRSGTHFSSTLHPQRYTRQYQHSWCLEQIHTYQISSDITHTPTRIDNVLSDAQCWHEYSLSHHSLAVTLRWCHSRHSISLSVSHTHQLKHHISPLAFSRHRAWSSHHQGESMFIENPAQACVNTTCKSPTWVSPSRDWFVPMLACIICILQWFHHTSLITLHSEHASPSLRVPCISALQSCHLFWTAQSTLTGSQFSATTDKSHSKAHFCHQVQLFNDCSTCSTSERISCGRHGGCLI